MARWRDVKKGHVEQKDNNQKITNTIKKDFIVSVNPFVRVKAFVTDMFMIMMPILYVTTYFIMDGKDDFQSNSSAHLVTTALFGIISIIFWIRSGQTPGLKAYELKLIDDDTKESVSIGIAISRYILFLVSATTILGAILPFFREDKKTLHDLVLKTSVIDAPNQQKE